MKIKYFVFAILFIFALYPITWLLQIVPVAGITPYSIYKEIMDPVLSAVINHFGWIVISLVSFVIVRRLPKVMHSYQEKIRKRQYVLEYSRWGNTPYIPPLLLYYMMNPPSSFSNRMIERANNDFYPLIVRDFQSRVAINGAFRSKEPKKRASVLRVVGPRIIGTITAHYIILLSIFYTTPNTDIITQFSQTEAKFLLPIIVYLVGSASAIFMAIGKTAPWKFADHKLKSYFYNKYLHHEPRILWVDVLPDSSYGIDISNMWEKECYRRIQLTYALKGQGLPPNKDEIKWDNPSIPGHPFPSYLDMSWVPAAREHVQAVHERWQVDSENLAYKAMTENKGKKKGQVIAFNKKVKYH